ncbi:MAG TPA: PLP-dependent cysteine synthase family protein [Rudaea sp.]|nr:PLP-dependent cysteine synthase family protein [Rudaea sp.]
MRPPPPRAWTAEAVRRIEADRARSADTHLLRMHFAGFPGVDIYFKDESTHPTGSLKHRLARSLFLCALCDGRLGPGQVVIDASSGSTAISEAYFARLLELPYIAVMPRDTAPAKVREIEALGGRCDFVDDGCEVYARAGALTAQLGGVYLDQFSNAERATDWRGNNNIAESIIEQMRLEPHAAPDWIVCGAGTGGTSATIGRYLRYRKLSTLLCVAEPSGSAFAAAWPTRTRNVEHAHQSFIEGIGRSRVEPSFVFDVVDEVIEVDDAASCAGAWLLDEISGRRFGGSSGTNLVASLRLAAHMHASGRRGSIVTLLCDRGERYADTVFDRGWLAQHGLHIDPWLDALRVAKDSGVFAAPCGEPHIRRTGT